MMQHDLVMLMVQQCPSVSPDTAEPREASKAATNRKLVTDVVLPETFELSNKTTVYSFNMRTCAQHTYQIYICVVIAAAQNLCLCKHLFEKSTSFYYDSWPKIPCIAILHNYIILKLYMNESCKGPQNKQINIIRKNRECREILIQCSSSNFTKLDIHKTIPPMLTLRSKL